MRAHDEVYMRPWRAANKRSKEAAADAEDGIDGGICSAGAAKPRKRGRANSTTQGARTGKGVAKAQTRETPAVLVLLPDGLGDHPQRGLIGARRARV